MTVIVAVVDHHAGRVHLAADSAMDGGDHVTTTVKLRTIGTDRGPLVIGGAGRSALLPVAARVGPLPTAACDLDGWAQDWAEQVTAVALDRHFVSDEGDLGGGFLLAVGGRLWEVDHGAALPHNDYVAIGSGAPVALGALHVTTGRDPAGRLEVVMAAVLAHGVGVGGPVLSATT